MSEASFGALAAAAANIQSFKRDIYKDYVIQAERYLLHYFMP